MAKYRELQLLRDKVFKESLDLASRIGFRDDVIHEVAKSNSLPSHLQRVLFPNGKIDIAYYCMESWLEETVQSYKPVGKYEDNLAAAARSRLELMSFYKNIWADIRSHAFQYTYLPNTLSHYWTLSDKLLLLGGYTQYDVIFMQLTYYTRRLEFKKAFIDIENMYINTPAEREQAVWDSLKREIDRILNHSNIGKAADVFGILASTGFGAVQALYPEPIYPKYTAYTPPPSNSFKADSSPLSETSLNESSKKSP